MRSSTLSCFELDCGCKFNSVVTTYRVEPWNTNYSEFKPHAPQTATRTSRAVRSSRQNINLACDCCALLTSFCPRAVHKTYYSHATLVQFSASRLIRIQIAFIRVEKQAYSAWVERIKASYIID